MDGRIDRNIRARPGDGVGQIVPAPRGDRGEAPVRFDELERRDMIRIGVRDVAARAEWRHHDQRYAGAVAKEIERLNIAQIPVSAAFVHGNHDRRIGRYRGIGIHKVDDFFDEALEQNELRRRRMAVDKTAWLDPGHRRQRAAARDACV